MATDRNVDQDVAADVEVAEKGPDYERKVGEPIAGVRRPKVEVADQDLYIAREDLGAGSETFIAAGATIPPELAALPRRHARAAPRKKP
jgi:hypothetical protein